MTEWRVVEIIVLLVGLFITIGTPVIKLIRVITEVTAALHELKNDLDEFRSSNSKSHERIFDRLDDTDQKLVTHDMRITVLEQARTYKEG